MPNPFDLDSLDLQVSPIQGSAGLVEPQTKTACVAISLMSNLCCVVARTVLACVPIIVTLTVCTGGGNEQ
jgi:hypothetical protein